MIAPEGLTWYFVGILILSTAYMVNAFLSFAATNAFEIYFFGIGPTEILLMIMGLNTAIIFLGTEWWPTTVPICFVTLLAGFIALAYRTHKMLWALDMKEKKR